MVDENTIQQVMRMHGLKREEAKRKAEMSYAQRLAQTPQPGGKMVADKYVKPHDTQRAAAMIQQLLGMRSMGKLNKAQEAAGAEADEVRNSYLRQLLSAGQEAPQQAQGFDPMAMQKALAMKLGGQ